VGTKEKRMSQMKFEEMNDSCKGCFEERVILDKET
jgi:hypothetical protein